MRIGKNTINENSSIYVIAEAGINHNGNLEIAKKMIEKASKCGTNAIKFQSFFAEELISPYNNTKLFDWLKKLSLTKKQQKELKKYSERKKIEFISTPSGNRSLKILKDLRVKAIKVASPDLTDYDFLRKAAKTKIPLILSTGMSTLSEIKSAVKIIKSENCPFSLLHCNSSYPSPVKDANLSTIPFFKKIFSVPVGYSDHTIGIDACLSAVSMGASIIEKHFTLDKKMEGPDQKLSANPKELKEMISKIRTIEKLIGTPRSGITQSEKKFRKSMRKSIHSVTYIKKGTTIKKSMLTLFRPGDGIPPSMIPNLVGMKIKKDVKKGIKLRHDMFYK